MGVIISFDSGDLENYCNISAEKLQNFNHQLRDITWAWGSYRVGNNFELQQYPNGLKWPPLSDYTKDNRRNKNKDTIKILQDTGTLMSSLINAGYRQSAVVDAGSNRVEYGTPVKYAGMHEFGGKTAQGYTVPPRSYMPTSDRDAREWQEAVAESIKEQLLKK